MPQYKHFEPQQVDDVIVLHLVDQQLFKNLVINEFEDELLEYLNDSQPQKLLVNFGPVAFCGTSAINALLRAKSRLMKTGGRIKCCGMNENIRGEFQMLNLDGTIFEIYDSASEALEAFAAETAG